MLLRIPHGYRARWHYLLTYLLHRWPRVLFILSTLYILLLINERKHPFTHHAHAISSSSIGIEIAHRSSALSSENHGFLPVETAQDFCYAHSFAPYTKRSKRRKVYDLFLLNTELDWLEVRLHTLSASVDYFIIVESPITFTGHQKPLILKENWERFKEFHSQIIHHVLEDPPQNAKRTWDVEDFQRNAMFSQVVPQLEGIRKAEIGDVLVVSDVDEIPRPATLVILRNCAVPKRVTIRSQFYYYGFQWRHRGEQWAHPQATLYNGPTGTILPADLRNGEGEWNRLNRWWEKIDIWNAGWHCSTCFETIEEVLGKLGAFSHVGLNQEVYRDRERIVERVRGGKDLWDREGEVFDRVEGNEDIPDVLKVDRKRWGYLLDRDGRNAGFKDYVKGRDTEK